MGASDWVRLGILVGACGAIACGDPHHDEDDPVGCGLPEPCGVAELRQGSQELDPQEAAACMHDTIASGESAHLRVVFVDTREITYDLYIDGDEPAVLTEIDCEFDGPCMELEADRCVLHDPDHLDCSGGTGPARVCGAPVNWCTSSSAIEHATCP
jgi:hypothetical protein